MRRGLWFIFPVLRFKVKLHIYPCLDNKLIFVPPDARGYVRVILSWNIFEFKIISKKARMGTLVRAGKSKN